MIYAKGNLLVTEDGSKTPPSSFLGTFDVFAIGFILTDTEQFFYTENDFSDIDMSDFSITLLSQEEAFLEYQTLFPNAVLNEDGSFGLPIEREMPPSSPTITDPRYAL